MRNTITYLLVVFSATSMVLFFLIGSCASVPVMPNESIVEGVVSEYSVVSSRLVGVKPEQALYRLTITIESTDKISNGPNFLEGKEGRDIQFYTKEKLSADLFGKKIKAKARYRGDERGGKFWIREIQIQ